MFLTSKVLLISADSSMSRAVTSCLTQAGYKVMNSARGAGALEWIHTEDPMLVILDIDLPDYNSLAIIRAIRAEQSTSHLPVILMGPGVREEDVLLGLEVGADLCLLETFHPQVFIARVRSLLRRCELVKTS